MGTTLYRDRREAGRRLAVRAERLRHEAPVVLALPRGGVPVAAEVARVLAAPLDVIVVRKVGVPGGRIGAVAEGGLALIDHDRARQLGLTAEELSAAREAAHEAADTEALRLRDGAAPLDIVGRTAIIVDDGAGTGISAVAAARTARRRGAARTVLALPTAGSAVLARLGEELDEVICVEVAPPARWYEHGEAVSDAEIVAVLREAGASGSADRLHLPQAARAAIVLATADEFMRRTLDGMGFATLQVGDTDEDAIAAAARRLRSTPATEHLQLGLFGLGETAEATLAAAAVCDADAIVAAGGSPDELAERIAQVTAPTLLVVGGEDREAMRMAHTVDDRESERPHRVAVIAGATREFPEPGALEQVAHLAGRWFARRLTA